MKLCEPVYQLQTTSTTYSVDIDFNSFIFRQYVAESLIQWSQETERLFKLFISQQDIFKITIQKISGIKVLRSG